MNSPSESSDSILRVHIVARLGGCSCRTVRRKIEQRLIPAVRIGRRAWGIRRSDLPLVLALVGGCYVRN